MRKSSSTAYDYAIRSIPILCVTGFVTLIAGEVGEKRWAIRVGICLFMSGFVVWAFANGGGLLWALIQTIRNRGFRVFSEHPWFSAILVFIILFLFYVGYRLLYMILTAFGFTR